MMPHREVSWLWPLGRGNGGVEGLEGARQRAGAEEGQEQDRTKREGQEEGRHQEQRLKLKSEQLVC